jgi:hypothetical protein
MSYDLSNYVDVKTRIKLFYERYPDGSLQFEFKGSLGANIWGVAYAYRTPDDPRPATGNASELAEGKTAFTRGSELMNLETSAIGRAIGNLGIGIEGGMATSDEVQFAKERQRPVPNAEAPAYDPWEADKLGTVEQALAEMGAQPLCNCGTPMIHKTGNRKSDGKPYSGFFCANNSDACKPLWNK